MLPKFARFDFPALPIIKKSYNGKDASFRGAFPYGAFIGHSVTIPRDSGIAAVVMRIWRDVRAESDRGADGAPRDLPFKYVRPDGAGDVYSLTLDTGELLGDGESGLFYYEYIFVRGGDTLFSSSTDNVHYEFSRESARKFRLLVYEKGLRVPNWVGGGIMYQIFPDRFAVGDGEVLYCDGSVLRQDRNGGEPEYAPYRGGDAANNDFFGGNLWGVAEKLPYLKSLGVSMIYLNPIFSAKSNHKYDTSDYMHVDGGFGSDAALEALLRQAHEVGVRVILDGVFNHTGNDSIYFDAYGRYGKPAADPSSPYHVWYRFADDGDYDCWWGVKILPKLDLNNADCRDYFVGNGGVAEHYGAMGIDGWRLDVADELPNSFLNGFVAAAKKCNSESFIVGEVWENAADKIAYGMRREYFRGGQLDSVMNYPLRTALLDYAASGDAEPLGALLTEIYSSYPPPVADALMNIVGTHDTERAISLLGDPENARALCSERDNGVLSRHRLTAEQYERGAAKLKAISAIQYTVYGFPCVYYGDEIGMQGLGDPFCRRPMAWDGADADLLKHYRRLGAIRRGEKTFCGGSFAITRCRGGYFEFVRKKCGEEILVAVNFGYETEVVSLGARKRYLDLYLAKEGRGTRDVPPGSFAIIKYKV